MQFWLENITELFHNIHQITPNCATSLESQMNAVTRGVILVWIILITFNYKNSELFLILSIFFIIILYYTQRNMMKENYLPLDEWKNIPHGNKLKITTPEKYRFCMGEVPINYDNTFCSNNQKLAGAPNPKTFAVTPVIPPPYAWDYWSEDFIVPSHINDSTHTELYQSGYVGDSCCGNTGNLIATPVPNTQTEQPRYNQMWDNGKFYGNGNIIEPFTKNTGTRKQTVEKYNGLSPTVLQPPTEQHTYIKETPSPGDIMSCGSYNPDQMLKHNLPSNLQTGQCQQEDVFNEYNKNMFTQIINPDSLYARSEVIEPIQSNIGISWDQQFQPVTCDTNKDGSTTFVTHDPRIVPPSSDLVMPTPKLKPDASNVYDPRYGGYGTSYRSYIDTLTGQPRFYYDDIDSVRKPNYLIRSNIDDAPWAHQYGPIDQSKENNDRTRALAQDKFMRDTTQQRTELQERLLRNYNTKIGNQRRMAPLRRDGRSSTAGGGMGR
jgi:hypothetical protein